MKAVVLVLACGVAASATVDGSMPGATANSPPVYSDVGWIYFDQNVPTEDLTIDGHLDLDAPTGKSAFAYTHPHGSYSTLVRADLGMSYLVYHSNGVPSCLAYKSSALPASLLNLSPFAYAGRTTVRSQDTDHFRLAAYAPTLIGADVDPTSG